METLSDRAMSSTQLIVWEIPLSHSCSGHKTAYLVSPPEASHRQASASPTELAAHASGSTGCRIWLGWMFVHGPSACALRSSCRCVVRMVGKHASPCALGDTVPAISLFRHNASRRIICTGYSIYPHSLIRFQQTLLSHCALHLKQNMLESASSKSWNVEWKGQSLSCYKP